MSGLGIALLIMGVVLVVAEAHVPGGVLGVAGGVALIVGGVILIGAAGGGAAVAIPVGVGLGIASTAWVVVAGRKAAGARRLRIRSGPEGLSGRVGVVRRWSESGGQVFVDGALWRARHEAVETADALKEGDAIVVERVTGLTLCVRHAEDWELMT